VQPASGLLTRRNSYIILCSSSNLAATMLKAGDHSHLRHSSMRQSTISALIVRIIGFLWYHLARLYAICIYLDWILLALTKCNINVLKRSKDSLLRSQLSPIRLSLPLMPYLLQTCLMLSTDSQSIAFNWKCCFE
jgi:hypothetical protein